MSHELVLPRAPITAEGLRYVSPRLLVAHDKPLGIFASNPRRLTPHIVLAAHEGQPTPHEIAEELVIAAGRNTPHEDKTISKLAQKVSAFLHPDPRSTDHYTQRVGGRKLAHNAAGHQIVPIVALLAGHWLQDRDTMEKVLPPTGMSFARHGIRLACLQACLKAEITPQAAAQKIEIGIDQARGHFADLKVAGLVQHSGTKRQSRYRVMDAAKPFITTLATEVHSLKEPSYADALREVVPTIVGAPDLYGTLARAAIDEFLGQQGLENAGDQPQ